AMALSRFGTDEQRKRWLPGAADGTAPLTLAVDLTSAPAKSSTALLPFAQVAAAALVSAGDAMWLLDLSDLDGLPVPLTTHALAVEMAVDVAITSASAERVEADAGWVRDVLRAALAAGQLGNADAGVREAASYVSER